MSKVLLLFSLLFLDPSNQGLLAAQTASKPTSNYMTQLMRLGDSQTADQEELIEISSRLAKDPEFETWANTLSDGDVVTLTAYLTMAARNARKESFWVYIEIVLAKLPLTPDSLELLKTLIVNPDLSEKWAETRRLAVTVLLDVGWFKTEAGREFFLAQVLRRQDDFVLSFSRQILDPRSVRDVALAFTLAKQFYNAAEHEALDHVNLAITTLSPGVAFSEEQLEFLKTMSSDPAFEAWSYEALAHQTAYHQSIKRFIMQRIESEDSWVVSKVLSSLHSAVVFDGELLKQMRQAYLRHPQVRIPILRYAKKFPYQHSEWFMKQAMELAENSPSLEPRIILQEHLYKLNFLPFELLEPFTQRLAADRNFRPNDIYFLTLLANPFRIGATNKARMADMFRTVGSGNNAAIGLAIYANQELPEETLVRFLETLRFVPPEVAPQAPELESLALLPYLGFALRKRTLTLADLLDTYPVGHDKRESLAVNLGAMLLARSDPEARAVFLDRAKHGDAHLRAALQLSLSTFIELAEGANGTNEPELHASLRAHVQNLLTAVEADSVPSKQRLAALEMFCSAGDLFPKDLRSEVRDRVRASRLPQGDPNTNVWVEVVSIICELTGD